MKNKKIPSFEEFLESYSVEEIGYSPSVTDEKQIEYWNELVKKNLSQKSIDAIRSGNVIDLRNNTNYDKPRHI